MTATHGSVSAVSAYHTTTSVRLNDARYPYLFATVGLSVLTLFVADYTLIRTLLWTNATEVGNADECITDNATVSLFFSDEPKYQLRNTGGYEWLRWEGWHVMVWICISNHHRIKLYVFVGRINVLRVLQGQSDVINIC